MDPSTVAQRWKKWCTAFEYYIVATGVNKEEQKRALFLHVSGPEVQEIFATLTAGDNYKTAKEVLDKYFVAKINVRYERFLFKQCAQQPQESLD